ncbi:unnamed protein product [Ectocarpus fasciculatus]
MPGRGGVAWEGGGAGRGVHMEVIPSPRINQWRHLEGAQGRAPLSQYRQGGVGPVEEVGVGVEGGVGHNTEGVAGEEEGGAGVVGGEEDEEEEEKDKQMDISKIRSSKTRGGTCWRVGRHNRLCRHVAHVRARECRGLCEVVGFPRNWMENSDKTRSQSVALGLIERGPMDQCHLNQASRWFPVCWSPRSVVESIGHAVTADRIGVLVTKETV